MIIDYYICKYKVTALCNTLQCTLYSKHIIQYLVFKDRGSPIHDLMVIFDRGRQMSK